MISRRAWRGKHQVAQGRTLAGADARHRRYNATIIATPTPVDHAPRSSPSALVVAFAPSAYGDVVPAGTERVGTAPRQPDAYDDVGSSDVARAVEKQGYWAGSAHRRRAMRELPCGCRRAVGEPPRIALASFSNPYYSAVGRNISQRARREVAAASARAATIRRWSRPVASDAPTIDHRTREEPKPASFVLLATLIARSSAGPLATARTAARSSNRLAYAWSRAQSTPTPRGRWRPRTSAATVSSRRPGRRSDAAVVGCSRNMTLLAHQRWRASIAGKAPRAHPSRADRANVARIATCRSCAAPLGDADDQAWRGWRTRGVDRTNSSVQLTPRCAHLRGDADARSARDRRYSCKIASRSISVPAAGGELDVSLRSRGVGHRFPGNGTIWTRTKSGARRARIRSGRGS